MLCRNKNVPGKIPVNNNPLSCCRRSVSARSDHAKVGAHELGWDVSRISPRRMTISSTFSRNG
jgi:hypothetical protein